MYQKYKDDGVEFISLTGEDAGLLPEIKSFVESTGITWPVGYGAVQTLQALEAEYIPSLWVVDRSGRIIWNTDVDRDLEGAVARALAAGTE